MDNIPNEEAPPPPSRMPPYISFATFLTFLKALKTDGLPPQIDKSVLNKLSGGVQGQMKLALRSLGLMEGDIPTPALAAMVDAYETPTFDGLLLKQLHATYPYLFALDLTTATPTMFADAFNKATGAQADVSRKGRTFFLHAAKKVGVPLGARILAGSASPRAPTNGSGRRKVKVKGNAADVQPTGNNPPPPPPPPMTEKALEYRLVDLMTEAANDGETMQAIIKVITFLKTREAAKQKKTATDQ